MVVGIYFVLFLITLCLHFFMVKVKKTSRNITRSNEGQKGLKGQKENNALMSTTPQTLETQKSLPPQYTEEDAVQFHNQQQK